MCVAARAETTSTSARAVLDKAEPGAPMEVDESQESHKSVKHGPRRKRLTGRHGGASSGAWLASDDVRAGGSKGPQTRGSESSRVNRVAHLFVSLVAV